ncbi:MAG TPA: LEPR-XLL domain-containing protein, partial [Geobacteraceae bacterium]|nr:LEPR-XLL domain-containing protein [Geobacteraceae bacterium]
MANVKSLRNPFFKSNMKGNGRHKKNGNGNGKKPSASRKVLFEALEPRVLLSSDFAYAGTAAFDLTLRYDDPTHKLQLIDNATSTPTTVAEQDLSDTSAVKIYGSSGDDKLTVDFSSLFEVSGGIIFDDSIRINDESITGGGNDILIITGRPNENWNITGKDSGTADGGITFSGIEKLTGAADNRDTFTFKPGGSISGAIDGGLGGYDRIVTDGIFSTDDISSKVVFNVSGTDSGIVSKVTGLNSDGTIKESQLSLYSGIEPVTDFQPEFADVQLVNSVDIDGDGYAQSFRIKFDVNSNVSGDYYVKVYEEGHELLTSSIFAVNGAVDDPQWVTVNSGVFPKLLEHGSADFTLSLRYAPNNTQKVEYIMDERTMPYGVELPSEDPGPAYKDGFMVIAPWQFQKGSNLPVVFAYKKDTSYEMKLDTATVKIGPATGLQSTVLSIDFNDVLITNDAGWWYTIGYIDSGAYNNPDLLKGGYLPIEVSYSYKWSDVAKTAIVNTAVQLVDSKPTWDNLTPENYQWYAGDTHFHSDLTTNLIEYGTPLAVASILDKANGMDWFTFTDHSGDLDPGVTTPEHYDVWMDP